jgi:hypothetical protein
MSNKDILHRSVREAWNVLYDAVKERWDYFGMYNTTPLEQYSNIRPISEPIKKVDFFKALDSLESLIEEICNSSFDYNSFGQQIPTYNRIAWGWQRNTAIPRYNDTISDRMNEMARLLTDVALLPDPGIGMYATRDLFAEYINRDRYESASETDYADGSWSVGWYEYDSEGNKSYYGISLGDPSDTVDIVQVKSSSTTHFVRGKVTKYNRVYEPNKYKPSRGTRHISPNLRGSINSVVSLAITKNAQTVYEGTPQNSSFDFDNAVYHFAIDFSPFQSIVDEAWATITKNGVCNLDFDPFNFEYIINYDNFPTPPYKYFTDTIKKL